MQAWMVAMVVVVAAALALTVYGALSDRAKNRRRAEEMLGPPKRTIPNLPADARSPAYVTEAQARRQPSATATLAPFDELRARTADQLRASDADEPTAREADELRARDAVEIPAGYASADFVNDAERREAVLDEPDVLVCDGPVEAIRELLPALEHAIRANRPLVVVAPRLAPDVLGTLEVNAIQGKVRVLAVLADDAVRDRVVAASGATPVDATDRHSGWLDPGALGRVVRWTSTTKASRLAGAAA